MEIRTLAGAIVNSDVFVGVRIGSTSRSFLQNPVSFMMSPMAAASRRGESHASDVMAAVSVTFEIIDRV